MKPTLELSQDVEKLIDFLAERPRASYAEMSQWVNREIAGRDRYVLASARRVLERRGILFVTERGAGIARASNRQVATLSTTQPINKIRRTTGVARKRHEYVNIQGLTADERLNFDLGRSVLEGVRQTVSRSVRNTLMREIIKADGGIVSINSLVALPRHRK